MNKNKLSIVYEQFHRTTSIQKKIINSNSFTYRIILNVINKYLKPNDNILDIGCGAGTLVLFFASKGNKAKGIDISKSAIETCRESADILDLNNATFEVCRFPDETPKGKFDFTICSEVLEHLEKDNLALSKIYSLLNKNGRVFISTPSLNALLYKLGLATEFDKRVGHLRRYYLSELVIMSEKAGFRVIESGKTEGVLRNFLFLNPVAGEVVRFMKSFIADGFTLLDNLSLKLFGESQIYVILEKI